MDLKKACAVKALGYVKAGQTVGLGGGQSVAHLARFIANDESLKTSVTVVTPSTSTRQLCMELGLRVAETCTVSKVDVAFDGCDRVDKDLNALKSAGAIHTREKTIAAMATEYILLVDNSKVEDILTFSVSVTLEVIPAALSYVLDRVTKLGYSPAPRKSAAKDGHTISDDGNVIVDVVIPEESKVADSSSEPFAVKLNKQLRDICGVVETSLFTNEVTAALVATESGTALLENRKQK